MVIHEENYTLLKNYDLLLVENLEAKKSFLRCDIQIPDQIYFN